MGNSPLIDIGNWLIMASQDYAWSKMGIQRSEKNTNNSDDNNGHVDNDNADDDNDDEIGDVDDQNTWPLERERDPPRGVEPTSERRGGKLAKLK